MNKKVLKILFIIFIMNINIMTVSATDCNDISKEVDQYYSYKEELEELDCTNVSNEDVVNSCNDINMSKNLIVQNLMRLSDEEKVCSSVKPQVNEILKENEKNCGRIFDDSFYKFINTVMRLFYIIGPILLIVFGTLDYTKVIISSDKEALKKANKKFFKRVIATFILFLTPLLTNLILSINSSGISLSGNAYTCKYTHINYKRQFQIITIKPKSSTSGSSVSGSYSSILEAADALHKAQITWTYSTGSDLFWSNIEQSINNPNMVTCCATYVSSVLYKAGLFTEEEMNANSGYNAAVGVYNMLNDAGWREIFNYSELEPGDIVFMTSSSTPNGIGHVQIYAGNGTWYNAGSTPAIQRESPYASDASGRFISAMRK